MTTFKHTTLRLGILLLAAILFTLPILASAAEEEGFQKTGEPVTAAPVTTIPQSAPSEADGGEDGAEATVAGAVADFLRDESAGILSGATLLLTLILSLGFRKRVIPSLLDALGSLIGKSREAAAAITEGHEAEHAALTAILDRVEGMLSEARAAATAAEEAAAVLTMDQKTKAALQATLAEQSDLLYEILMSANLPQYQKDRIGTQHARLKAALSGEGHD